MSTTITTDARSRVVLPGGRGNQQYIVQTFEDGSMFLEPAVTVSRAQLEYHSNSELRQTISEAAASPTVTRSRRRRD